MNEIIFFVKFSIQALLLFIISKEKELLRPLIVVNLIIIAVLGGKQVDLFGFDTNVGNSLYAVVFLATSIIASHTTIREFTSFLNKIFIFFILFIFISYITLLQEPTEANILFSLNIESVFNISYRILTASFIAFYFSNLTNYFFINQTKKPLWKRKIAGNIFGQFIDSVLFFTLAFGGVISNQELVVSILAGFSLKSMLNVLDTPLFLLIVKGGEKNGQKNTK